MRYTIEHQERLVHFDLWAQRLASSNSFKNNSTAISYLQRKKYAPFAKLLNGKLKQQIVAVVSDKLCLHRYMSLLKISNGCWKTHCSQSRSGSKTSSLYLRYVHGCIACGKCLD